ncbi:hypothetical protein UAJ10_29195 [Nitrospirillum sp. BR 11164]|uniref:tetratricopeptide repeat protein n=1 Tax=Nitrospirillum sp. BR 11164 TaxID=3104324 RepID=UPI002AFDF21B|nr:hypothetical protein [Nitrospirillum sp. BR 11164]MEA1653079.1 hypothetical protein [Nitrospirillum sp. BR 11164]
MRSRRFSASVLAAGLAASLLSGCAFFEGDDDTAPAKPDEGLLSRLAQAPETQPAQAPATQPAGPAQPVTQAPAAAPTTPVNVPVLPAPAVQAPPDPLGQAAPVQTPDTIMPGAQGRAGQMAVSALPLDGHINPPVDPPDAQRLVAQADAQMEDKNGKGPSSQDMASALALFDQAMARGSLKAREALAVYYYYGRGTARDPQKAAQVVKPAAQAGLGMAALIYGQLYNNGSIPGGGAGEAQYWYNIARRAGCAPCISSHQEFLNSIEAKLNLPASKGQGDLASDPIVLPGITDSAAGAKREYTTLGILYPGWKQVEQRQLTENGRTLDQFTLENAQQRRVRVYFDATDWGKPTAKTPGAK